jgi:hypothetical protein
MLSERKKKTIVLTLALVSLVLNIIISLPFYSLAMVWYKIRLYYWGWIPAFILPLVAIIGTICWKPGNVVLRCFVLFLSIMAIIIAGILYFLLLVAANFNP